MIELNAEKKGYAPLLFPLLLLSRLDPGNSAILFTDRLELGHLLLSKSFFFKNKLFLASNLVLAQGIRSLMG